MPQQTDRTIYVGSVGKEVDEPALLALFGHCGAVSQLMTGLAARYENFAIFERMPAIKLEICHYR